MPNNVAKAFFRPGGDITIIADANLTGKRFARFTTGGTGMQPTGNTAQSGGRAAGVIAHDVSEGNEVHLRVAGVVPVVAGEDLSANTDVSVGSQGRAVAATSGGEDSDASVVVGTVTADAAEGSDAPILLK